MPYNIECLWAFVAWNGPEIQHCDNVLRGALNRYFGAWQGVALHYFKACKVSHNSSQKTSSWLNSENASKVFNDERLDVVWQCAVVLKVNTECSPGKTYLLWVPDTPYGMNVQVLSNTGTYTNIAQF